MKYFIIIKKPDNETFYLTNSVSGEHDPIADSDKSKAYSHYAQEIRDLEYLYDFYGQDISIEIKPQLIPKTKKYYASDVKGETVPFIDRDGRYIFSRDDSGVWRKHYKEGFKVLDSIKQQHLENNIKYLSEVQEDYLMIWWAPSNDNFCYYKIN